MAKFYCTRPRLSALLLEHGQEAEQTVNPFNQNGTTWSFEITPELKEIVAQYYAEIGKPLPKILKEEADR